jgi:hypothetical protein
MWKDNMKQTIKKEIVIKWTELGYCLTTLVGMTRPHIMHYFYHSGMTFVHVMPVFCLAAADATISGYVNTYAVFISPSS